LLWFKTIHDVKIRMSFSLCNQDIVLIMTNGGSMVTIDLLVNDLPGATFTVGNAYTIMMAGRLNAGVGDVTGTYNGGFDVTFTYVPF